MPLYGTEPYSIQRGGRMVLLNAETVTAPQASAAFTCAPNVECLSFTLKFASSPTASVSIQGSNEDVAATYQDLYTFDPTKQYANQTLDAERFAFYRVNVASQSGGGAVTVIVKG